MERHRQGGWAARGCARPRSDLNRKVIALPQELRSQIAAIEFCQQSLGDVDRFEVAVQYSLVHVFDYNREAFPFRVYYEMKHFRFQLPLWTCALASVLGILLAAPAVAVTGVGAQSVSTTTPTPDGSHPYITNTYTTEPAVNVRAGPSSVNYRVIGTLPQGATAPALGVSPGHDWIQIAYPAVPGGIGWVYAPYVTLSPGFLPVVEPPPTATPPVTATLDPTLAAAFNVQSTATRLPTFTPPAALVIPTFPDASPRPSGFPMGFAIIAIGLVGSIVFVVSLFGRRS